MRPYYILHDDDRIPRKVHPRGIRSNMEFDEIPALSVLELDHTGLVEYTDWIERPRRIISERMKTIVEKTNVELEFKRLDLLDNRQGQQLQYWIINVPNVECLAPQSEFYRNGMIKQLVLMRDKVNRHHFFQVAGIAEPYVVISLDVAESLLRRSLTGFLLKPVELI